MDAKLTYTTDTMNKVLNYLAERPYKEVAGLIGLIQSGEPHVPDPAETPDPAEIKNPDPVEADAPSHGNVEE